jgi:geranylgeranyl diphosphate/geranylgeranyl-bacteriochlorophyllide a reductase
MIPMDLRSDDLLSEYDVVIVGGGPSGATAAHDLARAGRSVLLIDKAGRIKPCGGAIPPRCIRDFEIPAHLIVARVSSARMIAPSHVGVDMPIENGYVGMVDREHFDEWLRVRAVEAGAHRLTGTFEDLTRDDDGVAVIHIKPKCPEPDGEVSPRQIKARMVIGADGAVSAVARIALPDVPRAPFVFAYHEIVRAPAEPMAHFNAKRCDVIYQGAVSPDFYGWIFPHGETISIGTGSANKGFSLRGSIATFRKSVGMDGLETIRKEGAPIPMKPVKRWDNGRDVLLAGDAAGVVAPASGEGIYYAMYGGRLAATAVDEALAASSTKARARALAGARKTFMKTHGRVFWVLGLLQYFWYRNDKRREQFVKICRDPDVQKLTWESYMNKELVRGRMMTHIRIFMNDVRHLMGFAKA